jgi:KDO2-lipid IV(A) lauroyltransferase
VLTGHFGSWEILSYVLGLVGYRGAVVARRLDNPYIDRLVMQFRQHTGLKVLEKSDDYLQMIDYLTQGSGLGMVGDQDAGSRGLFVNYFGRPASTFKSIATLSLGYRAPILVMGAARIGEPMRYRVYLEEVIYPEEFIGRPDAARALTQRYTDALEAMVRRHPEQYFWLHRRWKSQPRPGRTEAQAA